MEVFPCLLEAFEKSSRHGRYFALDAVAALSLIVLISSP